MNILELCLSPSLGGLELYMFRTAKNLSKTDTVFSVIHPVGRLRPYFEQEKLSFSLEKKHLHSFPLMTAKRIASLIDAREIDVLHIHWGKDFPLAALSKYFSKRKPRLIYTRQMKMTRSKNDVYHRFLYSQMDLMLCITDQLANEAKQYLSTENIQKIERLYYGVDVPSRLLDPKARLALRQTLGIAQEIFLVGLFGRIEENKRQHLLVEVIARAKKNDVAMQGLIVGHAMREDYSHRLKSSVVQQGLTQDVIFQGFVDRPQDWMQACDCVILATPEETFGLVLIEAMRVGVPVIGTNRGGVPEIIDHELTGLLFEPDNAEQLYECLLRLQGDDHFRRKIAKAGGEKAERLFETESHFRQLREYMTG